MSSAPTLSELEEQVRKEREEHLRPALERLDEIRASFRILGRDLDEDLEQVFQRPAYSTGLIDPLILADLAERVPDLSPWENCRVVCEEDEEQGHEPPEQQLAFLMPSPAETLRDSIQETIRESLAEERRQDSMPQAESCPEQKAVSVPPNWQDLLSLTIEQAAALLQNDRSTIYRLAKRGDLTINKRKRVTVKSILELELQPHK